MTRKQKAATAGAVVLAAAGGLYYATRSEPPVFPDVNQDGVVDLRDLSLVREGLYQPVTPDNQHLDVNRDGVIDMRDLSVVREYLFAGPIMRVDGPDVVHFRGPVGGPFTKVE